MGYFIHSNLYLFSFFGVFGLVIKYLKMVMEILGQYLVVIFAIALLVALKFYIINRRVHKQIETFIDPAQCIQEMGKQIQNVEQAYIAL